MFFHVTPEDLTHCRARFLSDWINVPFMEYLDPINYSEGSRGISLDKTDGRILHWLERNQPRPYNNGDQGR
jgi:hypothetical protein